MKGKFREFTQAERDRILNLMNNSESRIPSSPNPAVKRILVVGDIADEMAEILPSFGIGQGHLEFRFWPQGSPESEDYDWADALVAFRPPGLFQPEKVSWIHSLGAGVEEFIIPLRNLDAKDRPMLTRTTSIFGPIIAEYCISHILADMQHHQIYTRQQERKEWQKHTPRQLRNSEILILGAGDIGSGIASVFAGLGCRVRGLARTEGERKGFESVYSQENLRPGSITSGELSEVLARTDIVINVLPHTPATEELLDEEFVSRLENAMFINAGRGSVIREELLLQALDTGRIRRAVLDVFPREPLSEGSPLWNRDDVCITPHVAGLTGAGDALGVLFQRLESITRGHIREYLVDIPRGY